eukprot:s686_g1.t1
MERLHGDESTSLDADFSKLVAQQATITQSMLKRHQDIVSSLRTEIEVLRNELFDKDHGKSPGKSPYAGTFDHTGSFALNSPFNPASGAVTPVPSNPVVANFEEEIQNDTQELAVVPVVKHRVSLKVKPFLAGDEDSEEVARITRHALHALLPRSPNEGWRSMSNDTFQVRHRKSEVIPRARNSLVSEPLRSSRSVHTNAVHANAAARARTAESQRNGSRANTQPISPGISPGPRAISAPENVGVVGAVEIGSFGIEPWEFWPELFFEATVEDDSGCWNSLMIWLMERRASMHSYSAQKSRLSLKDGGRNMWKSDVKMVKILQAMVLPPDGKRRLFWLVFSLLLIAYDMVMVPLSVFELDTSSFEFPMTVFSATFWTELRPHKTAMNYVKTWMMADLILLMFEWTDAIISEMPSLPSLIRASRSLRILRFLRSAKLLRAAKLPSFMKSLPFISRSEYITLSLGILRQLLGILFINHTIASVWYLLGQNNGWLTTYEIPTSD